MTLTGASLHVFSLSGPLKLVSVLFYHSVLREEAENVLSPCSPMAGGDSWKGQDTSLNHLRPRRALNIGLLLSRWALRPPSNHSSLHHSDLQRGKKKGERLHPKNWPCFWASLPLSILVGLGLRNFTASVFMQPRSSSDPTSFWTWQMDLLGVKASSFLLTLTDSKVIVKLYGPQTVLWRSSWSWFGHPPGEEHHWHKRGAEPPGFFHHPWFSSWWVVLAKLIEFNFC